MIINLSYTIIFMNYSELGPLPSNSSIPNINTFFQIPSNPQAQELIEIKDAIYNIINKQEEITFEDENQEEPTEIKEIITKVQELTTSFQEKQNEISDIDKQYTNETKQIKKQMNTIDSMIKFLQSLNYESLDNEEIKEIITKMKAVGENIIKNEKITKLKQEYIQKRKELLPHLTLMKTLNQLNVANMCPICFKGKVTHYLHPCGHTGCKECLEKNRRERQTMTDLPQSDISFECPFCRSHIQSLKPLYFL